MRRGGGQRHHRGEEKKGEVRGGVENKKGRKREPFKCKPFVRKKERKESVAADGKRVDWQDVAEKKPLFLLC